MRRRLAGWMAVGVLAIGLAGAPDAQALPSIDLAGFVDPTGATVTDAGGGFSRFDGLAYDFAVLNATDTTVKFIQLSFETDVFDLSGASLTGLSPSDWVAGSVVAPGNLNVTFDAGTPLGTGDHFSFAVNGILVRTAALTDALYWDEGQIWAQAWTSGDSYGGVYPFNDITVRAHAAVDGGSTAPVPEPATMLMLGSGLLGLAGWARRGRGKSAE